MGQKQAGRRRRAGRTDPVQALSEDTGPRWGRGGFLPAPPSVVDCTGPGRPAHAPGLPCTRASLDRGENGAETRAAPGGPSPVCPQLCLPRAVPHPASTGLCLSRQHKTTALGRGPGPLEAATLEPWPAPAVPAPAQGPGRPLAFAGICTHSLAFVSPRALRVSCPSELQRSPPPLPGPGLCLLLLS